MIPPSGSGGLSRLPCLSSPRGQEEGFPAGTVGADLLSSPGLASCPTSLLAYLISPFPAASLHPHALVGLPVLSVAELGAMLFTGRM